MVDPTTTNDVFGGNSVGVDPSGTKVTLWRGGFDWFQFGGGDKLRDVAAKELVN